MDAIKFIKERNRMCKSFDCGYGCQMCPACDNGLHCAVSVKSTLDATDQIAIVEEWSAAHPRKTRQSVFLEQYPEAELDRSGYLEICPSRISAERRNRHEECTTLVCSDCRREFWMQEVE